MSRVSAASNGHRLKVLESLLNHWKAGSKNVRNPLKVRKLKRGHQIEGEWGKPIQVICRN